MDDCDASSNETTMVDAEMRFKVPWAMRSVFGVCVFSLDTSVIGSYRRDGSGWVKFPVLDLETVCGASGCEQQCVDIVL